MPGDWIFAPSGEFDLGNAERLRHQWYQVIAETEPDRVIVDLSDVTFLDSAALSVLAALVKRQDLRHGSVAVLNPSAFTLRVMGIAGLSRTVEILFAPREPRRAEREVRLAPHDREGWTGSLG